MLITDKTYSKCVNLMHIDLDESRVVGQTVETPLIYPPDKLLISSMLEFVGYSLPTIPVSTLIRKCYVMSCTCTSASILVVLRGSLDPRSQVNRWRPV